MRVAAWIAAWTVTSLGVALGSAAPAGAAQRYTVAAHDTLFSIARHFGVPVRRLAEANGLRDPGRIRIGEILLIPDLAAGGARDESGLAPHPAAGPNSPSPLASTLYVVRPGDTLYSLARARGLTARALAEANLLADPDALRVGQVLHIPPQVSPTASSRAAPLPAGPASRPPVPAPPAEPAPPAGPESGTAPQEAARDLLARRVTESALRYLGTRYVWGGASSEGVDCSGLVYLVYTPFVPHLPRSSYEQWNAGVPVAREDLAPGDLVFFNTDGSGASHVGIYLGDGRFVHPAARAGSVVIDLLAEPYYVSHYLGARRLI